MRRRPRPGRLVHGERVEFPSRSKAFSLVEVLIVIGIITVLIGLLIPAVAKVRRRAESVKCLSNLHQIGTAMLVYANDNQGLLVPLGPLMDGVHDSADPPHPDPDNPSQFTYETLGTDVPPWERWPPAVLGGQYAPVPSPADQPLYLGFDDPDGLKAQPWSSPVLICPADPQPSAAHSYLLNFHLVENPLKVIKYASSVPGGRSSSEVVVLGEKRSRYTDYYMEKDDFPVPGTPYSNVPLKVELFRHGAQLGSNYLFKDMHAANTPPQAVRTELDPWDL